MSDSQEKSDDLIAELARLMASSAGGAEPQPKPSVIKLPPLADATVKTSPVRIPGAESASATTGAAASPETPRPAPAAPPIRIPGMPAPDKGPVSPADSGSGRPAVQFEFGKAPRHSPHESGEPSAPAPAAQEPRRLSPDPPPRPDTVAHLAKLKFDTKPADTKPADTGPADTGPADTRPGDAGVTAPPAVSGRPTPENEPRAQGPQSGPQEDEREPVASGGSDGAGQGAGHQQQAVAEPDPIADLINAELDRSLVSDDTQESEPQSAVPPSTERAKPQAPVLPNPLRPVPEAEGHRAPPLARFGAPRPATSREADRFSVLPATPAEPEPAPEPAPEPSAASLSDGTDPMDEIESLIGNAVRVELEEAEAQGRRALQQHVQAPPVVSAPLTTPRRTDIRATEPAMDSAEAAILAAAAATGARVDRVEPVGTEGEQGSAYRRASVKPPRTSGMSSGVRQVLGIGVSAVLLLAGGFGLYWVLGMGGSQDPADAPVLAADAGPVKVEPEPEPVDTAETTSVVFDELDGGSAADRQEALVSRDETAGASPTEVASISALPPVVDDQTESGLANRKVRTVTVRPDGTIVAGEASLAGSEALPVDRPNVPEIAGAELEASELLTAAAGEGESRIAATTATDLDPIAALVSETGSATTTPLTAPEPLAVAATDDADQVFDGSLVAPVPMPRPASRVALGTPQDAAGTAAPMPPASTPLAAVSQPGATAAPVGGAYVQLSSQRTESDAQTSLRNLQSRMSSLLGGRPLDIRRVDLGTRGVWYRVVLPVQTFQDATQTCATIKANGIDCLPING